LHKRFNAIVLIETTECMGPACAGTTEQIDVPPIANFAAHHMMNIIQLNPHPARN
jgi:hypothetical protein